MNIEYHTEQEQEKIVNQEMQAKIIKNKGIKYLNILGLMTIGNIVSQHTPQSVTPLESKCVIHIMPQPAFCFNSIPSNILMYRNLIPFL